jgi:hypothetical protein
MISHLQKKTKKKEEEEEEMINTMFEITVGAPAKSWPFKA